MKIMIGDLRTIVKKTAVSLLVLLSACSYSLAQHEGRKINCNGWGKIRIGRSQKAIQKILGKSERTYFIGMKKNDDFFFDEYYSKGVSVMYASNSKTVNTIYFFNGDSSQKAFQVFNDARTDKGITWKSSQEEVLSKYGKPKKDFNGTDQNIPWRRIVYRKMDFRFENKILVRIGVYDKDKKETVFSI